MTVAVLIKAVADLDKSTYDPEALTTTRAAGTLLLNPLDARALAVASSLRAASEEVVAVTLGPEAATEAVFEALASGADRAIHVCDPLFAGSDALGTSLALARALEHVAPRMVLAGCVATDGQGGVVPALVAARLGWPFVDDVRSITGAPEGGWRITATTSEGRIEVRAPVRSVLAVGEKIAKPPRPTPEQREEAHRRPRLVLSGVDLHLTPKRLGRAASSTRVVEVHEAPPRPPALVLAAGDIDGQISAAVEEIDSRLRRTYHGGPQTAVQPPEAGPAHDILLLASGENGGFDPLALRTTSRVARDVQGRARFVAVGFGPLSADDRGQLERSGASQVVWWSGLRGPLPPEALPSMVEVARRIAPRATATLIQTSTWGREAAARLAVSQGAGLVADAEAFRTGLHGELLLVKRSFGGDHTVSVTGLGPLVATVVPTHDDRPALPSPTVAWHEAEDLRLPAPGVQRISTVSEKDLRFGALATARVVVGLGMGLGGPEGVEDVLSAVRPLEAAIGGTRRVVDQGWLPPQLQIGLTGRFVAPDLYLAVGVSGRPNHVVGVKRSRIIVALTTDPSAPIASTADVVIVGPWRTTLAPLARALAQRRSELAARAADPRPAA